MLNRRHFLATGAALGATGLSPLDAAAQAIAAQTARILVGFAPGGSTDTIARLVASKLHGYAPTVIVENRPGAGGRIAAGALKGFPADGSTMLLSTEGMMTLYPHVYKSMPYSFPGDFTPVTQVGKSPLALFAGSALQPGTKTVVDFIKEAKANPKLAAYGDAGGGSSVHFTGMMIAKEAGIELTAVHYKGAAPGMQDVLGGQIPVFIGAIADGMPFVNSGKARAICTTGAKRSAFLPDTPTLVEQGFKDIVVYEGFGLHLPAKVPANVVAALYRAMQDVLKDKDVLAALATIGLEPGGESPQEFAANLKSSYARWEAVVLASGFKPED